MKKIVLLLSVLASTAAIANDVDPFSFEKEHSQSSLSRAEAIERSKAAQAPSIRIDDQGRAITAPSKKTRAQVAAETLEAVRLGLITYGERAPAQTTAEQEAQIELAGQRAGGHSVSMN